MANIEYNKSVHKTSKIVENLKSLADICNENDGVKNPFFYDEEYVDYSDKPWIYTAAINENIVGFLCPYEIDKYNVEFCLFVAPKYRRQQIGSNLFFRMVMDFGEQSFRISMAPDNNVGEAFVSKMGFTYGSTECSMMLDKNDHKDFSEPIELSPVKTDDSIVITGIIDDIEIGTLELSAFDMTVCIHDVEVEEKFRGNGYGYRMLESSLNDIFKKYDSVILHVTKENTPAYALYSKAGFKLVEELKYYEL